MAPLLLPYAPPLDWTGLAGFLGARSSTAVERFDGDTYRRTFDLAGAVGTLTVTHLPARAALRVEVAGDAPVEEVTARLRRLFDLDADPAAVASALGRDPVLAPLVTARPGLRIPGAWDPFETAVRAVLGQQVSVAAATTLAGRLAACHGRPLPRPADGLARLFPTPKALADADPAAWGIPGARVGTIQALARAVLAGELRFERGPTVEDTVAQLRRLRGFGPWTAHYVALRACGERDAFPAGDLGIRRALGSRGVPAREAEAERRSQAWRPWRAYAALHLWMGPAGAGG